MQRGTSILAENYIWEERREVSMDLTKEELREKMLTKRANLTPIEREEKSRVIKEKLFNQSEFKRAKTIMFYVAFRKEVETEQMIKESLAAKKEVVVPITDQEKKQLYLSQLKDYDRELEAGTYGIKKPAADYYRPIKQDKLDLVVVPGVAFDTQGNRLGYGGGYYDRLLAGLTSVSRVGVSFEQQVAANIAAAEHDQPVNKIITEERIINCPEIN